VLVQRVADVRNRADRDRADDRHERGDGALDAARARRPIDRRALDRRGAAARSTVAIWPGGASTPSVATAASVSTGTGGGESVALAAGTTSVVGPSAGADDRSLPGRDPP